MIKIKEWVKKREIDLFQQESKRENRKVDNCKKKSRPQKRKEKVSFDMREKSRLNFFTKEKWVEEGSSSKLTNDLVGL